MYCNIPIVLSATRRAASAKNISGGIVTKPPSINSKSICRPWFPIVPLPDHVNHSR